MRLYLVFSGLLLFFVGCTSTDRVINNPDFEQNGGSTELHVNRIELDDSCTILNLSIYGIPGTTFFLTPETYLVGNDTDTKYKIQGVESFTLGE